MSIVKTRFIRSTKAMNNLEVGNLKLQAFTLGYSRILDGLNEAKSGFSNIPIEYIDDFQKFFRAIGFKAMYRYRGPRRPRWQGKYMCLKKDARAFSVYERTLYAVRSCE